jgi:hypothetical protein
MAKRTNGKFAILPHRRYAAFRSGAARFGSLNDARPSTVMPLSRASRAAPVRVFVSASLAACSKLPDRM